MGQLDAGVEPADHHHAEGEERRAEHGDDGLVAEATARREHDQQRGDDEAGAERTDQDVDARCVRNPHTGERAVRHRVAEVGHSPEHDPCSDNRCDDADDQRGDERSLHEPGRERVKKPVHVRRVPKVASSTSAASTSSGGPSPRTVPLIAMQRANRRRASARSWVATRIVVPSASERREHVEQLGRGRLIDAAERLVEQHDRCLLGQRPGEVGALQLAARELVE